MNEFLRRVLFLPSQSSTMAREIDRLHYWVIGSTFAGALLVTVVGGWFLFRYRRASRWMGMRRDAAQIRRAPRGRACIDRSCHYREEVR